MGKGRGNGEVGNRDRIKLQLPVLLVTRIHLILRGLSFLINIMH